jgi:cell division transport system ATP-binding protein
MSSIDAVIYLDQCDVFQNKNLILSNVTLEIRRGQFVYFIGRTGSGKTSLLKIIYGELPLTFGEASVAGYKMNKLSSKKVPFLRRKLGMVFQDFQLLTDRSAFDNLAFVLRATGWKNEKEIEQRIQMVLEKVALGNKSFKMPHELSAGEQQRLCIARALLNDPEIILADEPTGNLDPETTEEVMKVLTDISRSGRTVVMATHNYEVMKKFPARTVKFEGGKISESA